ncbi:MAG: DUF951 domain-containing protein [Ruminococcaceae bacterium]|nr:DUF951 domain-containing protein [Oscillospiraceae bacterium]
MAIKSFAVGDILVLRKPHPCGSSHFAVLRGGTDVKIRCLACAHDVTVPRLKLEKSIKNVIGKEQETP